MNNRNRNHEGASWAEIATALDTTIPAVRGLYYRALKKLRKRLEARGIDATDLHTFHSVEGEATISECVLQKLKDRLKDAEQQPKTEEAE